MCITNILNIQLDLIACLLPIEVLQCAEGWKGPEFLSNIMSKSESKHEDVSKI